MQGRARIRLAEEQPNTVEENPRDRVVIALRVVVHAADALVVASDDAWQFGVEVDVGPARQQISRGREVRFVSPI